MLLKILGVFGCCIIAAAYLSLCERKILGRIQKRLGPSYCGPFGLIQPIADALKLFLKRGALKGHSKSSIFSVCFLMFASLLLVLIIPLSSEVYLFNPEYGLLYIVVLMETVGICEILVGTNTPSKYGIIGGIRGYFQLLASHTPFVLSLLCVALATNSFNLVTIGQFQNAWQLSVVIPPVFAIFFVIILMILNRTPFDFTEAESELVAGNYVEYGGMLFAMIYLSEYINLMSASALTTILFLGAWNPILFIRNVPPWLWTLLKTAIVITLMIVIRAMLPRYKQQDIIRLSWKFFCPALILCLAYLVYRYSTDLPR
jgi:NADH-quinone oxidoreductase subunit H